MGMRPKVADEDVRDPVRLRERLELTYREIDALHSRINDQQTALDRTAAHEASRLTLSVSDRALLDQIALLGVDNFVTSKKAGIITVSTLPPTASSFHNQTVRLSTDGQVYTFSEATRQWSGLVGLGTWKGINNGVEFGGYLYNAANFTGSGAMSWTVNKPNVGSLVFARVGKILFVSFDIEQTTVGGVADYELRVALPDGLISLTECYGWTRVNDAGGADGNGQVACFTLGGGQSYFSIAKFPTAKWTVPATNNTYMGGSIIIPIQ